MSFLYVNHLSGTNTEGEQGTRRSRLKDAENSFPLGRKSETHGARGIEGPERKEGAGRWKLWGLCEPLNQEAELAALEQA